MNDRAFPETVQYEVVKANLEKNDGMIKCEMCGKQLHSISECHFDHIVPYAKGGKSIKDNCWILCVNCNLSKSDKQLKAFAMEEKAKAFLRGETIVEAKATVERQSVAKETDVETRPNKASRKMTKEIFDAEIQRFIDEKGDIHQIDFSREYNHLPGISYMVKYYGTLNKLKTAFGIADISSNWDRDTIKKSLSTFISKNGKITQKDMRKENGLPSINCILHYYPELKDFSDIKRHLCGIDVPEKWTKESIIEAGKRFVAEHDGKLTQKDCKLENGLPATSVIYKYFGDIVSFQRIIGAKISSNVYIPEEQIEKAVEEFFGDNERVIESRKTFLEAFPYGADAIGSRYGSFNAFLKKFKIRVLNTKKFKYSKQEVDEAVIAYVKSGKPMPSHKDLTKNGLPSAGVIMRYYDHWKEPFEMYYALYKKVGGTD